MKNKSKKSELAINQNFIEEYNEIVKSTSTSVVVETEWSKDGDFFHKLTMYDESYIPIQTLGSTTLIKAL